MDTINDDIMDVCTKLGNKLDNLKNIFRKIENIPNGPDRGSVQSQIDCAVQYAKEGLGNAK